MVRGLVRGEQVAQVVVEVAELPLQQELQTLVVGAVVLNLILV